MLLYCWADVEDVGPAIKQHWLNVSCLQGHVYILSYRACRTHGSVNSSRKKHARFLIHWTNTLSSSSLNRTKNEEKTADLQNWTADTMVWLEISANQTVGFRRCIMAGVCTRLKSWGHPWIIADITCAPFSSNATVSIYSKILGYFMLQWCISGVCHIVLQSNSTSGIL